MARKPRRCPGGLAYHVMNRATARDAIFGVAGDYAAFERALAEARRREAGRVRVCSYVLMPNHFHLVLWPLAGQDSAVTAFMKWLTLTHRPAVARQPPHRRDRGLVRGAVQELPDHGDGHFLKVCRYVERHPLRAGLVARAEYWPWSALHKRLLARGGGAAGEGAMAAATPSEEPAAPGASDLLDGWLVAEPGDWPQWVNRAETEAELEALRLCVRRGRPYGDEAWVARTAGELGLAASLRRPGRPRKKPDHPTTESG